MEGITITFEHKGIKYCGLLSPVYGAGKHVWHLMVNGYFFGSLRYCNGWVFDSIKMPEIGDFLGEYITAWYQ